MALKSGAVFFDRDGVLNQDVGYLYRQEEFRWIAGAREALRLVQNAGLLSIVVTNQSGVARGYYTEAHVKRLHDWMEADLARDGIRLTAFYTCPFHHKAIVLKYRAPNHPDRKPNPGMILRAMSEWNIDPSRALMVGDKESDVRAGQRAGIESLLFRGDDLKRAICDRVLALRR